MPHSGQLVLLTRCEDVPGFPALLAAALASQGAPWFPEYYVYEDYRAYGQTQYYCEVHVLNEERTRSHHFCRGFGITPEQSVHEAAYCALTLYRGDCDYLRAPTSVFRHFPAAREGPGCYRVGSYMSAQNELDPSYRCLVDLVQALDRRARQWYHYGRAARASHWDTLVRVRPYVLNGQIPDEVLDTIELTLPDTMALPAVGGVVPRHGTFIPPRGERGLYESPYGPQPSWDRRFYTPSVPLPWDYGGYSLQ